MQEVNALALDLVDELVVAVESSFGGAPVVVLAPVAHQLLQIAERWPLLPGRRRGFVGPAGATQTIAQVAQVSFRHVDTKRLHGLAQPSVGGASGRSGRTEPAGEDPVGSVLPVDIEPYASRTRTRSARAARAGLAYQARPEPIRASTLAGPGVV